MFKGFLFALEDTHSSLFPLECLEYYTFFENCLPTWAPSTTHCCKWWWRLSCLQWMIKSLQKIVIRNTNCGSAQSVLLLVVDKVLSHSCWKDHWIEFSRFCCCNCKVFVGASGNNSFSSNLTYHLVPFSWFLTFSTCSFTSCFLESSFHFYFSCPFFLFFSLH